ncbi:MAG: class I SAM-dependent methyltransferase [Myxococcota bacterium]
MNQSRPFLFDLWSRVYDQPLVQRAFYRPEQDAVLRSILAQRPRAILDIGCGTGQLTERFARELPDSRVVGCDFSDGMLRRAKARTGPRWVRAEASRLPFPDAAFDAVVTTEAFHWFPDQRAAAREIGRVLKPGGRLVASGIYALCPALARSSALGARLSGQSLRWPTRSSMRTLLEAAGLDVIHQRPIPRLPPSLLFPTILTKAARPRRV